MLITREQVLSGGSSVKKGFYMKHLCPNCTLLDILMLISLKDPNIFSTANEPRFFIFVCFEGEGNREIRNIFGNNLFHMNRMLCMTALFA